MQAVSAKPIPETDKRQDWPRLVAVADRDKEARLSVVESGAVSRAKGRFIYG